MRALGIFVKYPQAGRVKTRLADEWGAEWTARLYEAFLADLADRFRTVGEKRIVGFTPDSRQSRNYFQHLAGGDYELWPQPDGSLGERIRAFFAHCRRLGAERMVLVGSDSPTLPRQFLEDAFRRLQRCSHVLGPATDGGYYLIGQRSEAETLLDEIDWSSSHVLEQTVEQIAAGESTLGLLPVWYDVDTGADLDFLRGHLKALRQAGHADGPSRTEALLVGE